MPLIFKSPSIFVPVLFDFATFPERICLVYCNSCLLELRGEDRDGYCDKDSNDGNHDEEFCKGEAFILFSDSVLHTDTPSKNAFKNIHQFLYKHSTQPTLDL